MYRNIMKISLLTALMAVFALSAVSAQSIAPDYDDNRVEGYQYDTRDHESNRGRIDRYLDVEVWTNHSDGEFYVGDNVVIKFRANRDVFVAIYSIDSRGRVNLLFPTDKGDNNFIEGGTTYKFPGGGDDFDLVINGPEGVETIQIISSRERFPIPDWYPNSGLIADWDDRDEYLDYINNRYFVRYDGQRFAYDRTALYVNEWEDQYFQPVYYPYYPSWTVYGNMYIDYPIGSSIYINGVYWGITPLYIPRIYVGWHTFTIYDRYGYCWESDVHVYRHNTVVLDRHIVRPRQGVTSKYKEVRYAGYRNPVSNGYPNYKKQSAKIASFTGGVVAKGSVKGKGTKSLSKKYVRGETKVVKTDRGFESVAPSDRPSKSGKTYSKSRTSGKSAKSAYSSQKNRSSGKATRSTSKSSSYDKKSTGSKSYYRKNTSTSSKGKSGQIKKSGKSGGTNKQYKKSGSSKGKSSGKKSGSGKSYKQGKSGSSSKGSASSGKSTKSTGSKGKSSSSKGRR